MKYRPKIIIMTGLIVATILVAFFPSTQNGFVNNDDQLYLTDNAVIRNISWENIRKIFTSTHCLNYHPLALASYVFEYKLFGANPTVYHITNLAIHLLNSLLVFWFILLISKNPAISFMVSLFFGIHPLHVESVAWISERRDVLYALFYLGAIICYLYYAQNVSKKRYYYAAVLLFIFSVLSKAMALTLPFLLLLIDYFITGKIRKRDIFNKLPFFIIALILGLITFLIRYSAKDFLLKSMANFFYNLYICASALGFYFVKMVIPLKLSCVYPYTYSSPDSVDPVFASVFIIISICAIIGIYFSKFRREIIFGFAFFLITIFPTSNLILSMTASSIVNDRYFYITSIGLFFIVGVFFYSFYENRRRFFFPRTFLVAFFLMIICALVIITHQRCKVWKDSLSLWNNALQTYPDISEPVVYYNRGIVYLLREEPEKAIPDFNKALMLYQEKLGLHVNYSGLYNEMLKKQEGEFDVYNFMGMKFAELGLKDAPRIIFEGIILVRPKNTQAYINMSAMFGNFGQYAEAIEFSQKAIELDPKSIAAHYNMAVAYYLGQRLDLTCKYIRIALQLGLNPQQDYLKISKQCANSN